DGEVAPGREQFTRLRPYVRAQAPLDLRHLSALDIEFSLRHGDPTLLSAIEVERQGEADGEVVVGGQRLLASKVEHRVRAETGLAHPANRGVRVGAHRLEIGIVGERPGDQLVDGDLHRRLCEDKANPNHDHASDDEQHGMSGAHGAIAPESRTSPSPCPGGRPTSPSPAASPGPGTRSYRDSGPGPRA